MDPTPYAERVLDVVARIPPGRAMAYGDVAGHLDEGGPRAVGGVLARWGGGVPWWRVVRADGSPPPGKEGRALARLAAEGTPLRAGGRAVDMARARWLPVVVSGHSCAETVDADLLQALGECWVLVSDAGGAVGFPFPPVDPAAVHAAARELVAGLHPRRRRLFVATDGLGLAGWVVLELNEAPLTRHWGTVLRLQTLPRARGRGVAAALLDRLVAVARDEVGLEALHLAARGGMGLEAFYSRLGWEEVGRVPGALRVGPGEDRDEVLMVLRLVG